MDYIEVHKLRCSRCGETVFTAIFADQPSDGLVALTNINAPELVVDELTSEEYSSSNPDPLVEERVARELGRQDLRVVRFLRADDPSRPHHLTYRCPHCQGEAATEERLTVTQYKETGGVITFR